MNTQPRKNENSLSQILYRVFVGVIFGFANIIPGVSGGTAMVVFGMYERIILVITDFRNRIREDWKFFLPIVVGMGISIFLFGSIMDVVLTKHESLMQMFFIGVIVFSVPMIAKKSFSPKRSLKTDLPCVIAFLAMLGVMIWMAVAKANAAEKKKKRRWHLEDTQLTLLGLPTFIWYVLFSYLPMFGILISFKQYKLFQGHGFIYNLMQSEWIGFKNFRFFLTSHDFTLFLRNTLGYNIIFITLGTIIPVTLAIIINELYSRRASKVYQTLMFFPHFLSWVVVSYFVFAFLNTDYGMVNRVIEMFGGERHMWYQEPQLWPFFFVFLKTWKGTGYSMVVYLATITAIDQSMYEAAMLDGASKWQQARYITLPSMKHVVIMMFILAVGGIFSSDFGLFYQTTQRIPGSLYNVASTFDTYIYNALQQNADIGKTSAVSTFQAICCCITILTANKIVDMIDSESSVF